jgi:hypothetical protein
VGIAVTGISLHFNTLVGRPLLSFDSLIFLIVFKAKRVRSCGFHTFEQCLGVTGGWLQSLRAESEFSRQPVRANSADPR